MDLLLHSAQLFIYRTVSSILLSPSPAQYFNPARMNREIKKQKMRHDERGSQRSAGCGQVKRWCVLRTVEGRHTGWRFLISAGPLLHFLEPDTVFCGGQMRLGGKKQNKKKTLLEHLLFILFIQPLIYFHLYCVLQRRTHTKALDLIFAVRSVQVIHTSLHIRHPSLFLSFILHNVEICIQLKR